MASLKAIRKRIASVRSTQQITKAMKMVAAAKLRRAQDAVVHSRVYAEKLGEVVAGLVSEESVRAHQLVQERDPESRVLLVLVTADRGLCGGFNANLIRKSEAFLAATGRSATLSIVGRKGHDFYKRRAVPIIEHHTGAAGKAVASLARDIVAHARSLFTEEQVDAVYVLYTRFRSALSQVPTLERLLPIETPARPPVSGTALAGTTATEAASAATVREYLYEPDRSAVIENLLRRYVEVRVFQALLESTASELGARMTAMESATKNASEMIERLTLEMNRARQATITKELMEIVGGAEALKG
jgi:F-type H+-transporting ATPase subunit gamma